MVLLLSSCFLIFYFSISTCSSDIGECLGMYMYFHCMIIKYCCILHTEYGHRLFRIKDMVAVLLDASLNYVETETAGIYINISRMPNVSWKITCEREHAHFNCDVFAERLRFLASRVIVVNEHMCKSCDI